MLHVVIWGTNPLEAPTGKQVNKDIDMKNGKTQHTKNPAIATMQAPPLVKKLSSQQMGAIARSEMLRNMGLRCQASRSDKNDPVVMGRALRGGFSHSKPTQDSSSDVDVLGSLAVPAEQGSSRTPPLALHSNPSGEGEGSMACVPSQHRHAEQDHGSPHRGSAPVLATHALGRDATPFGKTASLGCGKSHTTPPHRSGIGLARQPHSVPRIEKFYKEVVCFDLLMQYPLRSIMELSPPNKVVVNTSSKRIIQDKKELIVGLSACLMISGQRCQTTWARKSIAGFKLREGSVIGCKVTLRGSSMYAFLDKLINLVLPRARPSLINQSIDSNGAYNIGISDPFLFVELEHHYDLFQSLQGFDIALAMPCIAKQCKKGRSFAPLFWSGMQLLTK